MKNILILTNVFILFLILNCQNKYNIETLLDWGINNKLDLSPSMGISFFGKKNIVKFIARADIKENQDLLRIPYSLMFDINKALELINLKSLNKQYKDFEKINITEVNFRKEKSFLAYILYLINHRPKKYQKTKFYEFYQKYLELLGKFYPRSPLFYGPSQIQYLAGTLLDRHIDMVKRIYEEEIEIYSNKTYYKKELDFDEYAQYRLSICKYGLNISEHFTIVPFLNYFDDDYSINNANYTIEENGDVRIYSLKEIKKGEQIILQAVKKNKYSKTYIRRKNK